MGIDKLNIMWYNIYRNKGKRLLKGVNYMKRVLFDTQVDKIIDDITEYLNNVLKDISDKNDNIYFTPQQGISEHNQNYDLAEQLVHDFIWTHDIIVEVNKE